MIKAEGGHWVMTDDERRQLVGAVGRWRQLAVEMMEAFGHDPGDPAYRGAAAIASEAEGLLELLRHDE
jgi:hypothetical protein